MRLGVQLVALALAGCNGIAGIADLHTGDLDGGSAGDGPTPDARASADGGAEASAEADASTSADSGAEADAPPPCPGNELLLRISVTTSSSTFTAVTGNNNGIVVNVGATRDFCFAGGTPIELQAVPDLSNTTHEWTGSPCSPARRCQFPLSQPTVIGVRL